MAWDKILGRGTSAPPAEGSREEPAEMVTSTTTEAEVPEARRDPRRSKRVYIAMAVRVAANRGKESFQEDTATETVNAHGCMVRLAARVKRGETVALTNLRSEETVECRVASLGQSERGKTQVGLEFTKPAAYFWHIAFPPDDWNSGERKRPSAQPQSTAPPKHS
jgi:hypothetical protein